MALLAMGGAFLSAWVGIRWTPSLLAAGLFALPAIVLFVLALQPPVEIHDLYLAIGKRKIPWIDIARLDRTNWRVPLAVRLTLREGGSLLLVYPGDFESAVSLTRQLRRYAKNAVIDGVPYVQYWSQFKPASDEIPQPKLLLPEDEREIERMFQQLRKVGRLDSHTDLIDSDEE